MVMQGRNLYLKINKINLQLNFRLVFSQLLGGALSKPATVEEIGSRMTMALEQDGGSWVLYNIAALYWRVVGNVGQAIECLRHAIAHSHLEKGRWASGNSCSA